MSTIISLVKSSCRVIIRASTTAEKTTFDNFDFRRRIFTPQRDRPYLRGNSRSVRS